MPHKLKDYQKQWDDIAEKYLALTDEARYSILHPKIEEMIYENEYKNILDFGCGNGNLAKKIANKANEIICVDSSPKMIKHLKRELALCNNIKAINGDQDEVKRKFQDYFDLCIMSLVLTTVPYEKEINSILDSINKALKNSGHLIVSVTHPAFVYINFPSARREVPPNFRYKKSGMQYKVFLRNEHGNEVSFYDYHWTIEDYSRFLSKHNFIILNIIEIIYDNNNTTQDAYLIFKCLVKK